MDIQEKKEIMKASDLEMLSPQEILELKAVIGLKKRGYKRWHLGQFDDYALFDKHRAFWNTGHILTFTDSQGTLMALRPDVTLSVMKRAAYQPEDVLRIFYEEDVFRLSKDTHQLEGHRQIGAELIAKESQVDAKEMLDLSQNLLMQMPKATALVVSHLGYLTENSWFMAQEPEDKEFLMTLIARKNQKELQSQLEALHCPSDITEQLLFITGLSGEVSEVFTKAKKSSYYPVLAGPLTDILASVQELPATKEHAILVDFSLVSPLSFYNGLVFQGFAKGCGESILSGGQYDKLAAQFLKNYANTCQAVGFALDLDQLEG